MTSVQCCFLGMLGKGDAKIWGEQGIGRSNCNSKPLNACCEQCFPSGDLYHHRSPIYSAVLTAVTVIVVNSTDNTSCHLLCF